MATTTPLGFQAPDGGDLIRNGDNAIANNAELSEVLHAAEHARLIQLERAAGFSGTGLELADAVVAPLLDQPTSQVRTKLDARYADDIETTNALAGKASTATLAAAADPIAHLDSVTLLCDFPVRENGETSWPQGFSINKAANEIYVANQEGTQLRIDVRNLTNGSRKSYKTTTTEDGAFTEALPWFYNGSGHLCFIVWPKAGGGVPTAYAIYNYTTGVLGPQISILGFFRGDVSGSYMVTSDAWTNTVTKFYVYDWASVQAGTPTLVTTIPVENTGATAAKNQGIAIVGSHLYLVQGSQSENPTIMVWDFTGKLKAVRQYTRAAFQTAVNALKPAYLTNGSYLYEAEGATNLDGKLVTGQIVNNNPAVASDARMLILQHNRVDGTNIASQPVTSYAYDTGWVALTLNSGWTVGGGLTPQIRRIGNEVRLRGHLVNGDAGTAAVWATAATIPAGFRPQTTAVFGTSTNSTATMSVRVGSTGALDLYVSVTTTAWRPINGITYLLD